MAKKKKKEVAPRESTSVAAYDEVTSDEKVVEEPKPVAKLAAPKVSDAVVKLFDGLVKKGLDDVKDTQVRSYLTEAWGGIKDAAPALFDVLVGKGEVVLSGKHLEASKEILKKMEGDVLALKAREIDQVEYEDLIWRRKEALFSLYNAQRISQVKPSIQKVLQAAEDIATILITKGIPFLLALV